jgi:hypothetical protein
MAPGSLVVTKNRWGIDSLRIGIVIERSETREDCWVVLWSTKDSHRLQEHREDTLLELDEETPEDVGKRGCISA